MENMTEKFAEFCEELKYEDLPPEVIKRTKLLILDTVGIIIRARHDAESTSSLVSAIDKLEMGNGSCQVFSDKKTYTPSAAALLNGTLAHSLDFDDTHAEASLHSSAPILSAALAAAQMNKSSGQELITACVVGYETQIRLGLAGGSSAHYKKGFHPTATCGVFGAVAAAGHLMGLTKDQFISAFGIALSQLAGSMQFLTDGAWTKRSHVGQAAQNGLSCAIMAGEGFKGPSQAFEGQWGYFHSYASGGDFKKALDGLGKKFETLINAQLKKLDMGYCSLKIQSLQRDVNQIHPKGSNTIEFLIRTNSEDNHKTLRKIVSGGELSRISLAIQVVASDSTNIPTTLLDEVDVGVSGKTSDIIGRLLKSLGKRSQILCITHQAQVAVHAQQHLKVSRFGGSNSFKSEFKFLTKNERVEEIARILGGAKVTENTRIHASELISLAND